MRLATRRNGTRDGELLVVSNDGTRAVPIPFVARTLLALLEDWDRLAPEAERVFAALEAQELSETWTVDVHALLAPLPRTFTFMDGSAYLNHVRLVRKARGAEPPPTLETDPLVYQACSDGFLAPTAAIPLGDPSFGCDFESELFVVTDDVPQATTAAEAACHVKLVGILNDVSLRNLIPAELAKGFGFFVSKPQSALAPFVCTPDELGPAWRDGRVHLPLRTWLDGAMFGDPEAGSEMHFSFHDLIAHAARTRPLGAGTIIGSGTVSNEDRARGSSCLAERRTLETLEGGRPLTPFLTYGQRVAIEMTDAHGRSLFGRIEQTVAPLAATGAP